MKKIIGIFFLFFVLLSCSGENLKVLQESEKIIKQSDELVEVNTNIDKKSKNIINKYSYDELRGMCNQGSYGCFYYIALLEANDIYISSDNSCPYNYQKINNESLGYSHKIKELPTFTLCKENPNLESISKNDIEKIKNNIDDLQIKGCFGFVLENILSDDHLFDTKLKGLKLEDFNDDYKVMKLESKHLCSDSPGIESKIFFYSDKLKKYYLAENNRLENFLKGDKGFIILKDFVWLGEQDHNLYFNLDNSEINNKFLIKDNNYKNIIKNVFENNNSGKKIINLQEKDFDVINGEINGIIYDYNLGENYEGIFTENKFKFSYKKSNPYRGNIFLLLDQEIIKEAKNICSRQYDKESQISNITVYIVEISDSFEILNKKEIYSEKNIEQELFCNYYG